MRPESAFDEERVPDLAQSDPTGVAARATRLLGVVDDPRTRAVALWARGLARRELDELGASEDDLRAALVLTAGSDDRLPRRITGSLAVVVLYRGDADQANALMSFCEDLPPGNERGTMLLQRGLIRHRSGDLVGARADYEAAVREISDRSDLSSTRALINLGVLNVQQGDPRRGLDELTEAYRRADEGGHHLLAAFAEHNIGYAHASMGALSDALASYERAIVRFGDLGPTDTRVAVVEADRAEALLAAYLLEEADRSSSTALDLFRHSDHVVDGGEVALLAARVRLARGELDRARDAAAYARRAMEEGGRSTWLAVLDALDVQIDAQDPAAFSPLEVAHRCEVIAGRLDDLQWRAESQRLRMLAVRSFIDAGDIAAARRAWGPVHRRHRVASPLDRAARNYCAALLAEAEGDRAAARAAVTRGLADVAVGRLAASSFEVRAHVLGHLAELATLGLRLSIEQRDARGFLRCIERSRAMLLAGGAIATDGSAVPSEARAALRDLTRRVNDPALDPADRGRLDAERVALEREIARRAHGETGDAVTAAGVQRLFAATDDVSLLEYAEVDGRLWLAAMVGRRATLRELGPIDALRDPIEHLRFGIGRLQRASGSAASIAAARQVVARSTDDLRERLIPSEVRRRLAAAAAPAAVVPARTLSPVPWACVLADLQVPISVAASGLGWLQAHDAATGGARPRRRLVVAHGPDLDHAVAEASEVASCYASSTIVEPTRTADDLLAELPGADVAHLACHGSFRTDNPLFSSLRLADGDLTFYDLRGCARMPAVVVLSACDVGKSVGLEGGAFLGLSTALLQLGVTSVIAPVTEVSDERSIAFMARLHALLSAGSSPAAALARAGRDDDGDVEPIAAPFVCFGA